MSDDQKSEHEELPHQKEVADVRTKAEKETAEKAHAHQVEQTKAALNQLVLSNKNAPLPANTSHVFWDTQPVPKISMALLNIVEF